MLNNLALFSNLLFCLYFSQINCSISNSTVYDILNQTILDNGQLIDFNIFRADSPATGQNNANDSCLEDILGRWYETARLDFYQYSDLTANMFASRLLYQTMFTLSFDSTSLTKYCALYKSTRDQCDACPNSPNKAAMLNGFSLGDHICIEHLADYMTTTSCLLKQDLSGAFMACNNGNCSEYDAAPYVYTNPIELFNENDTLHRMAMDCRYLQCDIDCRQPIMVQKCGTVAASFVLDSLSRTFLSIFTGLKADAQSGNLWLGFPEECRTLMHVSRIDSTNDTNNTGSSANVTDKITIGNNVTSTTFVASSKMLTTTTLVKTILTTRQNSATAITTTTSNLRLTTSNYANIRDYLSSLFFFITFWIISQLCTKC